MRKTIFSAFISLVIFNAQAQDTVRTTVLNEVVVTGTKYEIPIEKSGKTITKLTAEDLQRNAGKSLADILNEVPGLQTDGNFSTPGANLSYYLRGGRNKNTLILIDGVPVNDPSAINAEYDLRYIPVSQIESIEVLKGGLGTLYGTGAAAGVISIKLKSPTPGKPSGNIDLNVASYNTFSQSVQVGGAAEKFSYMVSGSNINSQGFSAAEDLNETGTFDKDGFDRLNGLIKLGYKFSNKFNLALNTAYEQFKADYDAFEFTDADNSQKYDQYRVGLLPTYSYGKGEVSSKFFYNVNNRKFESSFPSEFQGKNFQGEVTHRHNFSAAIQTLTGINYQRLAFEQKNVIGIDSTHFTLFDPYISLFVDLPVGFNLHAGARLNTHNLYGSKFIYNVNPSFVLNKNGDWKYKVLASVSTSYITPSLYQLYSIYGNKDLNPEEALNYETGFSIYKGEQLTFNFVAFQRQETEPIDFVSLLDEEGNYIGGQYQNLTSERQVDGIELSAEYKANSWITAGANYSHTNTDKPTSFYKIPKDKFGVTLTVLPTESLTVALKYNYTGARTTFDFNSFRELELDSYSLVDVFASYGFLNNKLTAYGAVNNVFDENFTAIYGYTTRGRNFSLGLRYNF